VDRGHGEISIRRQCELLDINRFGSAQRSNRTTTDIGAYRVPQYEGTRHNAEVVCHLCWTRLIRLNVSQSKGKVQLASDIAKYRKMFFL
jgi:hypothetical protein